MAIKSNKRIDFEYEYENDGNIFSISLRLFESEPYGHSIGLIDEAGEVAAIFPVAMFQEVTDFLVGQGVLENKRAHSPSPVVKDPPKMVIGNSRSSLPKPKVVSSKPTTVNKIGPVTVDLEQESEDDVSEYPDSLKEEILKEKNRIHNIQEAIENSTPTQSLSSVAEQPPVLSEEEAQNIMKERQMAASKSSLTAKKIKKT